MDRSDVHCQRAAGSGRAATIFAGFDQTVSSSTESGGNHDEAEEDEDRCHHRSFSAEFVEEGWPEDEHSDESEDGPEEAAPTRGCTARARDPICTPSEWPAGHGEAQD